MAIRNIIFDLGGVFIDINFHKTKEAFTSAGVADFDTYFHQSHSNPLFAQLERGLISPEEFYAAFRNETGLALTDNAIRDAWNAMLGDFRPASLSVLPEVKKSYNSFLLSNTNQIHYEGFIDIYHEQIAGDNFNAQFHKAYYSHEIKLRKPDAEAYAFILQENMIDAAETLFVDDTLKNIEGAKAVGLQTLWLQPGMQLEETMNAFL